MQRITHTTTCGRNDSNIATTFGTSECKYHRRFFLSTRGLVKQRATRVFSLSKTAQKFFVFGCFLSIVLLLPAELNPSLHPEVFHEVLCLHKNSLLDDS